MAEVASAQLAADNAKVLHSAATAKKVAKSVDTRAAALSSSLASLKAVVAKEVARAHGGKYTEDNASGPLLKVEFKDAKVTATYVSGAASSTWFEGEVGLDGSVTVTGKSLVAPEKGTLRCKEHTVECGFVFVPSVLRFSEKPGADGKARESAEPLVPAVEVGAGQALFALDVVRVNPNDFRGFEIDAISFAPVGTSLSRASTMNRGAQTPFAALYNVFASLVGYAPTLGALVTRRLEAKRRRS